MGFFLVVLLALLATSYLAFARFLAHRERMAALEAKRPIVQLQLPAGNDFAQADRLTDEILEACRQKGIDLDLEIR